VVCSIAVVVMATESVQVGVCERGKSVVEVQYVWKVEVNEPEGSALSSIW